MCGLHKVRLGRPMIFDDHTVGENEAIAVEEIRGERGVTHHILPQRHTNCSHANGTTEIISMTDSRNSLPSPNLYSPGVTAAELLAQVGNKQSEGLEDNVMVLRQLLNQR